MADISNDNNQKVTSSTPQQSDPQAPVQQPVTPPVTPPAQPPQDPSIDTGAEYEKTELPPEDLDARWLRWKCGVCNYTYEGSKPLRKCPRCGNEDQDKFLDAD